MGKVVGSGWEGWGGTVHSMGVWDGEVRWTLMEWSKQTGQLYNTNFRNVKKHTLNTDTIYDIICMFCGHF